jgi:enoyl-CoA hydratase
VSDVIANVIGVCGSITLNRPRTLNALTLDMVRQTHRVLTQWAQDPNIEFVLVQGAGDRGLCAGGDIRALYYYAISHDFPSAETFFREEYRLNYLIANYPKAYIALMDGIVMGGGVGISAHGTHRVVTDRSVISMPETSIGFVPDVGGTYLLANAPEELGTCMALTGCRVGADDAILCGIADLYIPGDRLRLFSDELVKCTSRSAMQNCFRSHMSPAPPGAFQTHRNWINDCFRRSTVEDIERSLKGRLEPEALAMAAAIEKNSPTALKVTLHALRNGRNQDLRRCLAQEYSVALACIRNGDFVEGIRAAIVEKDQKPLWRPRQLHDVTQDQVDSYFTEADLALEFFGNDFELDRGMGYSPLEF